LILQYVSIGLYALCESPETGEKFLQDEAAKRGGMLPRNFTLTC